MNPYGVLQSKIIVGLQTFLEICSKGKDVQGTGRAWFRYYFLNPGPHL